MYQNIGTVDRIIRVVAGVAIAAVVGLVYHSAWGLLGLILPATAGIGVCPIYLPFGISTRRLAKAAKKA